MYSSEDLERFYFQYKTEALPLGMSIETFCLKNKVPYNIFSKWYKDTRKKVVEVQVEVYRLCQKLHLGKKRKHHRFLRRIQFVSSSTCV